MNGLCFSKEIWSTIGDFSAFLYTLLTGIILIFIIRQYREASLTRKLAILPRLIQQNDDTRDEREILYNAYCTNQDQFNSENVGNLPANLRAVCDKVIYQTSDFGTFIKQGLIEEGFAKDWLHVVPVRLWWIMQDYAKQESDTGGYPYWACPLKYLARIGLERWFESQPSGSQTGKIIIPHSSKQGNYPISWEKLDKLRGDLRDNKELNEWLKKK